MCIYALNSSMVLCYYDPMPRKTVKDLNTKYQYKLLLISLVLYVLYFMFGKAFLWAILSVVIFGDISLSTALFVQVYSLVIPLLLISFIPSYVLTKMLETTLSKYNLDRLVGIVSYAAFSFISISLFYTITF